MKNVSFGRWAAATVICATMGAVFRGAEPFVEPSGTHSAALTAPLPPRMDQTRKMPKTSTPVAPPPGQTPRAIGDQGPSDPRDVLGQAQACGSLSQLIAGAADGAEVRVPACVFRESVVIERPLKLIGQPGSEIRGSDVYQDFERIDGAWRSLRTVPRFVMQASDQCRDPARHPCGWPEQVFWDGTELAQIPGHLNPSAGEFAVDAHGHIRLGADPSSHEIEVTVRQQWLLLKSADVVIEGFVMRHAASTQRVRALELGAAANVILRNNRLAYAHGTALGFGGAYKQVLDNHIEDSGGIGIAAWAGDGGLVAGNVVQRNGHMFPAERWWGAGINVVRNPVAIHENVIANNFGLGVFFIGADGCRLSENVITGHFQSGAALYRSQRCLVMGNKLKGNGRRGADHDVGITLDHAYGVQMASNVALGDGERLYARID